MNTIKSASNSKIVMNKNICSKGIQTNKHLKKKK